MNRNLKEKEVTFEGKGTARRKQSLCFLLEIEVLCNQEIDPSVFSRTGKSVFSKESYVTVLF